MVRVAQKTHITALESSKSSGSLIYVVTSEAVALGSITLVARERGSTIAPPAHGLLNTKCSPAQTYIYVGT